jgi:RNA-binding protein 7
LERVSIPKDRDGRQRTYGFITFKHECSVPYSVKLFEGTALFNKTLNLQSRNGANSDISHGINDAHGGERQRTQSLPINLGYTMAASAAPDYNKLLQLGQQMLIPGSVGLGSMPEVNQYNAFLQSNSLPVYRSQMNSSYYLGGNLEKVSQNSHDNYGHKRNNPSCYGSHGGGSRGRERNHSGNSRHSNSYSGNLHHRRDSEHWGSGRRRHY